jgi:hypothetical protein
MKPEDTESVMKLTGVTAHVLCACGASSRHNIGHGNVSGCDIIVACSHCGAAGPIYWDDLFNEGI